MKAQKANEVLLLLNGNKMLRLALKQIEKSSRDGYDSIIFEKCKSATISDFVIKELDKLGYIAHRDTHPIKKILNYYYQIHISWE